MKIEQITDNKDVTYTYWLGENAKDNWDIISKSDKNDIWFHLADYPSAHVILKISLLDPPQTLKQISKQILIYCGSVCRTHSKFPSGSSKNKMKIVYTEVRNLKKGKEIGSVFTRKENFIYV